MVLRAIVIALAAVPRGQPRWTIYVFGALLIVTGIRFLRGGHIVPSLDTNRLVHLAKRFYPVTGTYEGQRFWVKSNGVRYMTPFPLVLLLIETTDLVFAVDSIPAIYAITDDPFIVFTSNVFAIPGLRAPYVVLAGYLAGLRYLKPGLAGVLVFVGGKMVLVDVYKMPALVSLVVIISILGIALWASVWARQREEAHGLDQSDFGHGQIPTVTGAAHDRAG